MSELFHTPTVYPPLGKSTAVRVKDGKIRLYAFMTVSTSDTTSVSDETELQQSATVAVEHSTGAIRDEDRFTVLLWYSVDGWGTWKPAKFQEIRAEDGPVQVKLFKLQSSKSGSGRRQDIFWIDLPWTSTQPVEFCLKYSYGDGPWNWASTRTGLPKNGRLLVLPPPTTGLPSISPSKGDETDLGALFPELPQEWNIHQAFSCKKKRVWHLSQQVSASTSLELGYPDMLENWLALVKIISPWMIPRHGGQLFQCSLDALLLLLQRKDGRIVLVLPVSGSDGTRYVQSDRNARGKVAIRVLEDAFHPRPESITACVIVVVGEDVQQVLDIGFDHLRSLLAASSLSHSGDKVSFSPHEAQESGLGRTRSMSNAKALYLERVDWEKGLSYCTWNGLGWDLSEERLLDALQKLEDANIKIRNFLIDDNWQSLEGRNYGSCGTWNCFEANQQFPGGLKGCIAKIRERFPYIKHIGVWHALHGYWDGITPDSELGRKYKTVELDWLDNVNEVRKKLCFIHPDDIESCYDDFYKFLSECGVDSAKVDVQCRIDELVNESDRGMLQQAYSAAFRKASIKHFDSRVIYCMSHVPQVLYHALLVPDGPRKLLRTSDDFYPNMPSSHAFHIHANSHNMQLFSRLQILPDWDMFQTTLSTYATLHAVARCLSGGPIFFTDTPGKHDAALLARMCAPAPSGATIVPQPKGMARSVDPFMAYTDEQLLKIQTRTSHAALVGLFNVSSKRITELVDYTTVFPPLVDLDAPSDKLLIRAYTTGKIAATRGSATDAFVVAELDTGGWEVYTAVPVDSIRLPSGIMIAVAVFGLTGNFTGAAAVESWEVKDSGETQALEVELNALGVLAIYLEGLELRDLKDIAVRLEDQVLDSTQFLARSDADPSTLEISVARAWEQMKLSSARATCVVSVTLVE